MGKPVKDAKLKAQQVWPGATVVQRGKGSIRHQHPTDPNKFMLDTQAGGRGWHFGDGPFTEAHEVDTAWVFDPLAKLPWQYKMVLADYNAYAFREPTLGFDQGQLIEYVHPASGESVAFQPTTLYWTNDQGQLEPIADPQAVSANVNDHRLLWTGAYGTGIDFEWVCGLSSLVKYVKINSLADVGSPPQFIIDGGNPVLRVELLFQRSAGLEIWVDGVLWDEKANNPQETLSNVEFRAGGVPVWWFRAPKAWDAELEETTPLMRLRATALNLFVEILTPWSWLETAQYPIAIDVTIDDQVGATLDDASWEDWGGWDDDNVADRIGDPGTNKEIWTRFDGVTGVEGTIGTAYFEVYVESIVSSPAQMDIYCEDAAAPTRVTTANDYAARTRTTAGVTDGWDEAATGWQQSGSITAIIQELVDSHTVTVISHMGPAGGAGSGEAKFYMWDFDDNSFGMKLHIEYTAGVAALSINIAKSASYIQVV